MRRTPTTDTIDMVHDRGAAAQPDFEQAFRELARARAAYEDVAGDPENIPAIADAADRLERARQSMRLARNAAS